MIASPHPIAHGTSFCHQLHRCVITITSPCDAWLITDLSFLWSKTFCTKGASPSHAAWYTWISMWMFSSETSFSSDPNPRYHVAHVFSQSKSLPSCLNLAANPSARRSAAVKPASIAVCQAELYTWVKLLIVLHVIRIWLNSNQNRT